MFEKVSWLLIKILFLVFFGLILVYFFHEASETGYKVFSDKAKDTPGQAVESIVTVKDHESLISVGKDLEKAGIVDNGYITAMTFRTMDGYDQIKAGDYILNSSMRPSEILTVMLGEVEEE